MRIIIFIFSLQVCNHPELFERRDVLSPISLSIPPLPLPRLLYHYCIRPLNESRQRYTKLFQVFILILLLQIADDAVGRGFC